MAEVKKRSPRRLTEDEVRRLTSLSPDDITKEFMMDYFANFADREAKFIPQDYFVLRKEVINEYAKTNLYNQDVDTTIGRYIFNLFLIMYNPKILNKIGYVNETLNSGGISKISNTISTMLLDENNFTVEEYYDYLNRLNWFGFANSSFTTPSLNYDFIKPVDKVIDKRNELLKQHEEELSNSDVKTSVAIEEELVDLAKKELKNNPAYDLYDSGAKANFGNNYKNMNIMGGMMKNNVDGSYRMIEKSLVEGLDKEDIAAQGDAIVTGVYSRAVNTQKGGLFHVHL